MSAESSTTDADGQGIRLSTVLASWKSGKKAGAVEQLLSIRWDQASLFADMPMMNLPEESFGLLPRDEKRRVQDELIELVNTLS